MKEDEFDVAYRLLDDDLVDPDGRRCGKVDEIEFEGEPGGPAQISAVLAGPGALWSRLPSPFERLAKRVFGDIIVRVPWEEVEDVTAVVNLKRSASDLGLGRGDDEAARLISWIPGS